VTSYVIARTLGDPTASTSHKSSFAAQPAAKSECKISDADTDTDASASPTTTAAAIPISIFPPEDEDEDASALLSSAKPPLLPATPARASTAASTRAFFVDAEGSEDDGAARLAGVGVFSPVASMPGSPVVSRRNLLLEREKEEGEEDSDESGSSSSAVAVPVLGALGRGSGAGVGAGAGAGREEEGHDGRQGHERTGSDGSGANGGGSTSGESSFALLDREESFEDAGAHIRRRAPGTAQAGDDE
jgi:hypothetical protein